VTECKAIFPGYYQERRKSKNTSVFGNYEVSIASEGTKATNTANEQNFFFILNAFVLVTSYYSKQIIAEMAPHYSFAAFLFQTA